MFSRDLIATGICRNALQDDLQQEVTMLWHKDKDLGKFDTDDCIILPGGFFLW
ncbi:MAG: hypothetical protein WDN26_04495 [Chitinophagaceae bacterium]